MNKQTRIGVVVAVFLGVPFLITQWQNFRATNDFSTRDDSGEIVESGSLGVHAVKLGDCVLLSSSFLAYVRVPEVKDGNELSQVRGVPCTELHDAEVVGQTTFGDADFPGEEALFSRMEDICVAAYEKYTGVSYQGSPHYVFPFVPSSDSWTQGDRKGTCYAINVEDEQLGASIRK